MGKMGIVGEMRNYGQEQYFGTGGDCERNNEL
jgi:hypothetical protein